VRIEDQARNSRKSAFVPAWLTAKFAVHCLGNGPDRFSLARRAELRLIIGPPSIPDGMASVAIARPKYRKGTYMLKSAKRPLLAAALAAGLTSLSVGHALAQASSPDQIVGVWEAEDGILKIEMFEAGGSYSARMLYGKLLMEADGKTFKKDTKNPDPNLRGRSLEGIVFLTDLKWDPRDLRWEDGSWYSGANGRSANARAALLGEKMEVRVYMGTPALGRTIVLHRAR
jgi:uncharacterized protein (DUF2147 family)